jgi:superfamily II DNA or RNA helicase
MSAGTPMADEQNYTTGWSSASPATRSLPEMPFKPRKWQQECMERFKERLRNTETSFVLEACMGAGKSTMAAWIAKELLDGFDDIEPVDHVLVLVPWTSIQGDTRKGMLGSFGEMGLEARDRFFTKVRRLVRQPKPIGIAITVTLYQEVCCQQAIDTIRMWQADRDGFHFALICDEIHHTNEINSTWGAYVEQFQKLASYSIFMSGTFFRTDKIPISCIPLSDGLPIKHYRYAYSEGVKDNAVRPVTTREIDAMITLYDRDKDKEFEVSLRQISNRDLAEAKKQVLDPNGKCIRELIQAVHEDMARLRSSKFADAACLFVCRPGSDDYNYTLDELQEDNYVDQIADQVELITDHRPMVVTYRDRDSTGKISQFREGAEPYLAAINKVSEGCDIPRFRGIGFCRYTDSEMLFRQIVGRALRMHTPEDGTAAMIYIPAFPLLVEYAKRLYEEAQEGIRNRRCPECSHFPCICPCTNCGQRPCVCPCPHCGQRPCVCERELPTVIALDAQPVLDGGHLGQDHVIEHYVGLAEIITKSNVAHQHLNTVQLGHVLQTFHKMQQNPNREEEQPATNPGVEREKFSEEITRTTKRLAIILYDRNYQTAFVEEIEVPFGTTWKIIKNTWSVEQLDKVAQRLRTRLREALRHG